MSCAESWGVKQEFPIPLRALNGRFDHFQVRRAEFRGTGPDPVDGQLVGYRVADDAALAYMLPSGLELRLYQQEGLQSAGAGSDGGNHGREHQRCRDE